VFPPKGGYNRFLLPSFLNFHGHIKFFDVVVLLTPPLLKHCGRPGTLYLHAIDADFIRMESLERSLRNNDMFPYMYSSVVTISCSLL